MRHLRNACALVLAACGLYIFVSYRMALAVTAAEREELESSPADYGVDFESVRFRSRGGEVSLEGWYLPGRVGMPSVVFVHGIGSTRTGAGMTELGSALNRRGFGALLIDLRAHGRSGGERVSGGLHERFDVLGAFDYLVSRGVAPGKVGLLGLSMGAAAVALAAADEPRVAAVVLDSPFASAEELIPQETALRTPLPSWAASVFRPGAVRLARCLFDIDVSALAPESAVARLSYPVLVICAEGDDRVPTDHSLRVHAAAHTESILWKVGAIEHGAVFLEHKSEYEDRVADYFMSRLGV